MDLEANQKLKIENELRWVKKRSEFEFSGVDGRISFVAFSHELLTQCTRASFPSISVSKLHKEMLFKFILICD